MDKELIKKLSKAGVSSDVILALMLDEDEKPQPEQKPEPAKQPEQKPESAKQPEQKPESAKQPDAVGNDAILAAIEKLTGAVQAANIRNMGGSTPKPETADDVLAQIINPGGKEGV